MQEKIKQLFRRHDTEAKLLFYIAVFYFIFVVFYSIGDLKGDYPIILVVSGLLLHITAFLVWGEKHSIKFKDDTLKRPQYFGKHKRLIYKVLPFGLILTYLSSICYDLIGNSSSDNNIFLFLLFLLTAIPMIIYFFIIGGYIKKKHLKIFRMNIPIINYLYFGIIITVIAMGSK